MWKLVGDLSIVYKGLGLGALAVVAFVGGMIFRDRQPNLLTVEAGEAQVALPACGIGSSALPVIDVDQPTEYETATFALG